VALYRGDLLEEIYDDWCVHERQRLRALALDALRRAMSYHLHRHDWSAALKHGQRTLNIDPLNEPAHATVMRCHCRAGNRAAALQQYATCVRLLREELDVEPMAETVAIYEQIRAGTLMPPTDGDPDVPYAGGSGTSSTADAGARLQAAERDLRRARKLLRRGLHMLHSLTEPEQSADRPFPGSMDAEFTPRVPPVGRGPDRAPRG
jgi:tetratricopeptide (TPR) repeat protein